MAQLNVKRVNSLLVTLFEQMRYLEDEGRDLPIKWNMMHMYSSSQLAKILALRRGIDMELASIAATLHDIAVIMTKKRDNHAERAEEYVRQAIKDFNNKNGEKLGRINDEEVELLVKAISQHSNKEEYTQDSFVELLKDIDSLDRYLHGIKSEGAYIERCKKVFNELGIVIEIG